MPDAHATRHPTTNGSSDVTPHIDETAMSAADMACGVSLPGKPTASMLAAGARAGNVSVEVAWRVYQAMVTEA